MAMVMERQPPLALSKVQRRTYPGAFARKDAHVRNVFVEKWPSLVRVVLVAGAVLFVMIRWA
jgi:hypothetical protein